MSTAKLLTAVVLAAAVGCGSADDGEGVRNAPESTTPPPTTGPALTAQDVASVLKNAATAEEAYATEAMRYTTKVSDLEAQGLVVQPGVTVKVATATKTAYCLEASGAGIVLSYDSATGAPKRGRCRS